MVTAKDLLDYLKKASPESKIFLMAEVEDKMHHLQIDEITLWGSDDGKDSIHIIMRESSLYKADSQEKVR